MKELPFGVTQKPRVADTKAAVVSVSDGLEESDLHVNTWWSGDGFTLAIYQPKQPRQIVDLSWQEWEALKLAIVAIKKSKRGAK